MQRSQAKRPSTAAGQHGSPAHLHPGQRLGHSQPALISTPESQAFCLVASPAGNAHQQLLRRCSCAAEPDQTKAEAEPEQSTVEQELGKGYTRAPFWAPFIATAITVVLGGGFAFSGIPQSIVEAAKQSKAESASTPYSESSKISIGVQNGCASQTSSSSLPSV